MSLHRYPPESLMGDYARAGAGLLLTLVPLLVIGASTGFALMLGLVALLCLFFLLRTVERHRTVVSVDEDGVAASGWRAATVAWDALDRMTLNYYSLKRDRSAGWMQLTVKADYATVTVDSRLEGFINIVRHAARAARRRQIPLTGITRANLQALNVHGD